jgi:ribosome-associated translation inhibitor RaiA
MKRSAARAAAIEHPLIAGLLLETSSRRSVMIWALRGSPASRPKDLPDHVERRLRFALARFGTWIDKVVVFLQDTNGVKGGIDKVCRVLVKTRGCGVITTAATDTTWVAAVDRATTKIGETVSQQIDRRRRKHRSSRRTGGRLAPTTGID